jgi:hypothetical protein
VHVFQHRVGAANRKFIRRQHIVGMLDMERRVAGAKRERVGREHIVGVLGVQRRVTRAERELLCGQHVVRAVSAVAVVHTVMFAERPPHGATRRRMWSTL